MEQQPVSVWWFEGRTLRELVRLTRLRLIAVAGRRGWVNEKEAREDLGLEAWAAIERLLGGWQRVCERSTPDGLTEEATRLAEHLWAVRFGERASLAQIKKDDDELCGRIQAGGVFGQHVKKPLVEPVDQIVTGKTLALILAHVLEGDAEMTPVADARHIQIRAYDAVIITKEVLDTWKQTEGISKASFRRILIRRLKEGPTGSSAKESGLTRLSAARFSGG